MANALVTHNIIKLMIRVALFNS